ncbi:MAG: hypothetical protein U0840_06140 [Gemmataceae bacterium]
MSRRSFLVAIGSMILLTGLMGTFLVTLLRFEPEHHRRAAIPPGEKRTRLSQEFLSEFSEFVSAIGTDKAGWYGRFSDEQINSYLDEAFLRCGLGEKLLPDGISEPRVVFEQDRLRLSFRYRSGLLNSVVSISMRVWLPRIETNLVAVQIEGFQAGAMPFTAQWLLERISESARQQGIEVTWYRLDGLPVALLRFQADQPRSTLQLKGIQLEQGRITVHGRSSDESAALPLMDRQLARR